MLMMAAEWPCCHLTSMILGQNVKSCNFFAADSAEALESGL